MSPDFHVAAVGTDQTGHDAERRRLSRAVGTEQAKDLSGMDRKRKPIDGHVFAKAFTKPLDHDRGIPRRLAPGFLHGRMRRHPASPPLLQSE